MGWSAILQPPSRKPSHALAGEGVRGQGWLRLPCPGMHDYDAAEGCGASHESVLVRQSHHSAPRLAGSLTLAPALVTKAPCSPLCPNSCSGPAHCDTLAQGAYAHACMCVSCLLPHNALAHVHMCPRAWVHSLVALPPHPPCISLK